MKFGKTLQIHIEETMPEWRDKFLSYKELKKRLKGMTAPVCFTKAAFEAASSPPRGGFSVSASSVVDAVDQELRRASAVGGPAEIPEILLFNRSKRSKRSTAAKSSTGALGKTLLNREEPNASDDTSAESSVEHAFVNGALGSSMGKKRKIEETKAEGLCEADFIRLLNMELNKLNIFFIEKEEEYVIRLQELKDRIIRVKRERAARDELCENGGNDELLRILRDIVTFHGEMVLLENYSSLNYTGLVKILKKHDKLTGTVLRLPFIQSVLLQPFFTTELLSKLVRECENYLHSLFPVSPYESICTQYEQDSSKSASPSSDNGKGQDPTFISSGEAVETIYRSTVVALRTMEEIRHSSTRSIFSLPPISRMDSEEKFGVVIDERINPVVVTL